MGEHGFISSSNKPIYLFYLPNMLQFIVTVFVCIALSRKRRIMEKTIEITVDDLSNAFAKVSAKVIKEAEWKSTDEVFCFVKEMASMFTLVANELFERDVENEKEIN